MHIGRHIVQELVLEFGAPAIERWDVPMAAQELAELQSACARGRAHDVTLLILHEDEVAVVARLGEPDGAFCMPSGWVHPEESFVDGTRREAMSQTGLAVRVEDYVLRIHASFGGQGPEVKWTTHVMLARPAGSGGAEIAPQDGTGVAAARWLRWRELAESVNPALRASGWDGLRYRARIHEKLAELAHPAVGSSA